MSVEPLERRELLTIYTVSSAADSGANTLRQVITSSNADTAQPNVIKFSIGTGLQVINLLSALPAVTQSVTIDATLQPGYTGSPLIELNGAGAGSSARGLVISAPNTTVKGLDIGNFAGGGVDLASSGDVLAGSYIGVDPTGNVAMGTGGDGVNVSGANDIVGGSAPGMGDVISGAAGQGILILSTSATGDWVLGDKIGTNAAGTAAIPNGDAGILIENGAKNNLVGTNGDGINDALERNIISGNTLAGVKLGKAGTRFNTVAGNYIGTDFTGTKPLPNGTNGVAIHNGATDNLIGTNGTSVDNAGEANVISGNNGSGDIGVLIAEAGTDSNVVAGNFIGTDPTGKIALGNGGVGVFIDKGAQSNLIGTNGDGNGDAAERNVISGNAYQGIFIGDSGTDSNVVAGNYIGTDVSGKVAMPNGNNGIWIDGGASSNRIGAAAGDPDAAAEGNVISANAFSGIAIGTDGSATSNNTVTGNEIGTDPSGTLKLGNGEDGITLYYGAFSNTVGGPGVLANTIANNLMNGISLENVTDVQDAVRANRIFGNSELGIDLGDDGVTRNGSEAGQAGPNLWQEYPVLSQAFVDGPNTLVDGTAVGASGTSLTIDFFANSAADPSGFGQGQTYLGSTTVPAGTTFHALLNAATTPGEWISATATDSNENTSEFSQDVPVTNVTSSLSVVGSPSPSTYGQSVTFTATVSGTPPATGTIQFQVDGANFGTLVTLVNGKATSPAVATLVAGAHTVTAIYSGDSSYPSGTVTGAQTVLKAHLTITADPKSMTYGGTVPALTATISGFVNGDTSAVLSGAPGLSTMATSRMPAGNYPITVTAGTLSAANYDFSNLVNNTLIINKAHLTVTADPKTMTYGGTVPALTATITGFVNGDTAAAVSGTPGLSTSATSKTPASNVPITVTAGSLSAANYDFPNLVNSTLTINKAHLTVTADPKSMTYGGTVPALTATITGFVNGDTAAAVSGTPGLSTSATSRTPAGNVPITVTAGSLGATNYDFPNLANSTLTINKALLTVTADAKSMTVGGKVPALTATISGFVNGDLPAVVTGSPSLSTAGSSSSPVGSYPITVGLGTLLAANYSFAFANGTLTVSAAAGRPASAVFVIKSDDQVYDRALDASGNPTGGYQLTSTGTVKDLAVVRLGNGKGFEAFVIAANNQVDAETITASGATSSSYFATAYGAIASVSAGTDASGNPLLFAIGVDNQLYEQKFDSSGKAASPSYVKAAFGDFKQTFLTHDASGNPLLYAVGQDNQVYGLKMNAAGTPVGGLFKVDYGPVNQLAVGHDASNDPEIFVIGTDNGVYAHKLDATGSTVGSYLGLGGPVKSISVTNDASNNPELFAIGTDGQVYAHKLDATGSPLGSFTATAAVPGGALAIYAGTASGGNPELFAEFSSDSQVYVQPFDASGTSSGAFTQSTSGAVKKVVLA